MWGVLALALADCSEYHIQPHTECPSCVNFDNPQIDYSTLNLSFVRVSSSPTDLQFIEVTPDYWGHADSDEQGNIRCKDIFHPYLNSMFPLKFNDVYLWNREIARFKSREILGQAEGGYCQFTCKDKDWLTASECFRRLSLAVAQDPTSVRGVVVQNELDEVYLQMATCDSTNCAEATTHDADEVRVMCSEAKWRGVVARSGTEVDAQYFAEPAEESDATDVLLAVGIPLGLFMLMVATCALRQPRATVASFL